MLTKRTMLIVLAASALVLAFGIGPRLAHATPPPTAAGVTIPYPGQLSDNAGQPVADGFYDFRFELYDAETGGTPLWSESQNSVPVKGGAFVAALGSVNPLPAAALDGSNRWLAVSVRGPGETDYAALTPRQQLDVSAPSAPASPQALSCVHTHFGEVWSGGGFAGLTIDMPAGNFSGSFFGKTEGLGYGVVGQQQTTTGSAGAGVMGTTNSPNASGGRFINNGGGIGLYAESHGAAADKATIRANNTLTTTGMAAYLTNQSNYATANLTNNGGGEVLFLQNNGGSFLRGVSHFGTNIYRLAADGVGHSLGGWATGGADFAEMLPAAADLESGDVLVIGPDGKLTQSTEPYQTTVAGVYSTKPGFVGGEPVEGELDGEIPLAVVGVVPVKVSAENGAIQPGDLLVASAIPGHAMKAGTNPPQGTVIGKALEGLDKGTGVIKMLVTLQ